MLGVQARISCSVVVIVETKRISDWFAELVHLFEFCGVCVGGVGGCGDGRCIYNVVGCGGQENVFGSSVYIIVAVSVHQSTL